MPSLFSNKTRSLFSFACLTLALLVVLSLVARPLSVVSAAPQVVFTNSSPITVNTVAAAPTAASPYPSNLSVSGLTGTITKVTLTLNSITHPRASDIDVLLVGPTGVKFIPMSDAISFPTTNVTLTLDSSAATTLPNFAQLPSGSSNTYRPANYASEPDIFPSPAPAPPYLSPFQTGSATFATAFNGTDPNGTWSLYVTDDVLMTGGNISGGWTLNITTSGSPATNFTNSAAITINDVATQVAPASPYPSTIDVTGQTGVVSKVTVTLNGVTHTRAEDLDILLVSPNGASVVLMSDAGFNVPINATLTFDDAAPGMLPQSGIIATGTYKPTNYFSETNEAWPPPAPQPFYQQPMGSPTLAAGFNSFSPNGTWKLYVADDTGGESGMISGGWSLDITTAPYTPPLIACLIPNFTTSNNIGVGSSPTGIAVGDFNNDNKQDLVVTNQGANNVSVLIGDGAGGFAAPVNFATGTSPYSVAVGKFNNDANLDLVVVNSGSNNVSILLGDGLGGFSAPTNFGVGISPISVAVEDFNGDMKPDLAVANFGGFFAGTVSILLGTGTGTFGPATNFGVRTQPSFVAVGEFNGDNNKDLAVANFGSNNLSILMGAGNGTFTAAPSVNVGTGPVSIAIADYNGDGKSDLAVANYNSDNISLRFGTGAGTFTGTSSVAEGTNPISIVAADLNGDGKPDLTTANSSSNNVTSLLNSGGGGFPTSGISAATFNVGAGPNALVSGDFDGDGDPDFATANSGSNSVSVLLNACAVAVGNRFDFDGDRRTDFAIYRPSVATWYVNGSIGGSFSRFFGGLPGDVPVPADYNGDGVTDYGYFKPSTATWIVPGTHYLDFGTTGDVPVPADYDGDGRADIAVFRPSDGNWYIRRSSDNSWMTIPFGASMDLPVARDYDGDGKADEAIFRPSTGTWYILQSSDSQVRGVQFGMNGDRPVAADYDGDGKADIAVWRSSDGGWYILRSRDNSFMALAWGASGDVPVPGDYDGDGKFDQAVWRPSNGYWYALRSFDGTIQYVSWGTNGDIPLPSTNVP
ncbi:MAG TPA: FG-GAP-like repeat-containing protein [Pyrinomonadaceae bacterium]